MGTAPALTAAERERPSPLLLWSAILVGPTAWSADLGVSYALVRWSCSSQRMDVLHAITWVAFAVAVAGVLLSWWLLRATRTAVRLYEDDGAHRARFMATLGITSSAFFAMAIVAFAIPRWILDACQ